MSRVAPVRIHRYAGGFLGVDWSDGNRTALPYRWLRGKCPCTRCVDEWTGQRNTGEAEVPFDVQPVTVTSVGRYALRVVWSDGHDTGIYSYEYLRELSGRYAEGPVVPEDGVPACGSGGGKAL